MTVTVSANGQTAFLVQLLLLESVRCAMKYQIFVFLYEGAWEALSYRVIYGSGCSINIADIAPKGQGLSMQPDDINMNDVFKAVHIGVREDIEHAVFSLVKELKNNAKTIMQYNFTVLGNCWALISLLWKQSYEI